MLGNQEAHFTAHCSVDCVASIGGPKHGAEIGDRMLSWYMLILQSPLLQTKSPKNIRVDAFFCPFCGFTPSSIALIKQHLNYHRVWNKPVCQICWRGHFFTTVDFQYHCELHTSKRTSNMRRQNVSVLLRLF